MKIRVNDLSDSRIKEFLEDHIREMKSVTPPQSKHALDIDGLKAPEVMFYCAWEGDELIACGALKELDRRHAEIKSMRVAPSHRGGGIAKTLLKHLLKEAHFKGFSRVSLETGSFGFFEPARKLYEKFGFQTCSPFADYVEDPNSVFMSLLITQP